MRSEKKKPQPTSPPPPAVTAGRRSRSAAVHPDLTSSRGGESTDAGEVVMVRRSSVAPCLSCGLCGGALRDVTSVSECVHSFCWKCIYHKLAKEDIKHCPTCGNPLGGHPFEKLRSMIFRAKRRKVLNDRKERKQRVSAESTISSVVDIVTERSIAPQPLVVSQIEALKSMIFRAKRRKVLNDKKERKERVSAESTLSSVVDIVTERSIAPQPLDVSQMEALKPDHSLQHIREKIFHAKRRKIVGDERKEIVSSESTFSSVVDIVTEGSTAPLSPAVSQIEAQKEIEVIDEADEALGAQDSVYESAILNLASVGRDALSRIRCRDFYSACHLSPETGALIVWQPAPILEEMVVHDQLAPRQDPQTSRHPTTFDIVEMSNTSDVADNSFHARITVQDDENLSGDLDAWFSEGKARIMRRYGAHTSQLKAENSKLIKELVNERAAALERTRILEERHQRELENQRTAAAERIRILEERLQRDLENERKAFRVGMEILDKKSQIESQTAMSCRSRSQSLEAENARLYEEVETGRADNQALMSDILEKCSELATLKYYSDMIESDKTYLENEVEDTRMELGCAKKEHARYVRQVLNAARAVPNNLETMLSDAHFPDFS